jgi:hypothetical protein
MVTASQYDQDDYISVENLDNVEKNMVTPGSECGVI